MKVKVEKLSSNPNTFRTPLSHLDIMPRDPSIGSPLIINSTTFPSGGIMTSIIQGVEDIDEKTIEVHTLNSTYLITKL